MQSNAEAPRILITGGLGHIGSWLIRSLRSPITIVDDLSTQRYCSLFNLNAIVDHQIRFWHRGFETLTRAELAEFDVVIHLASRTDAVASFENREDVEEVNLKQTVAFLQRAAETGIELFIFPSSTSVYGVAKEIVTEDDLNCINPQSPYAESKLAVEDALRLSDVPYVIFRFGTIYGTSPGMRFHTAINKFCFQASIGDRLTIWRENYHQKRPYLDLTDCVGAIKLAISLGLRTGMLNQVYNVASGNHTVAEVISIIERYADIDLEFVDTPLLNQQSYEVSCDKIAALGYRATGSLERAIVATLQLLAGLRRA